MKRPEPEAPGTLAICLAAFVAVLAAPARAEERTYCTASDAPARYQIRAVLSPRAPQVVGAMEIWFENQTSRPLHELVLVLFANRFSRPDPNLDEFSRPYVYPREEFEPGRMEISQVSVAGEPARIDILQRPNLPQGTFVRIPIPTLEPRTRERVTLRFRTTVPYRFGSFGVFDQQITMAGGWYPYVAALSPQGAWQVEAPPPPACFNLQLIWATPLDAVVAGRFIDGAHSVEMEIESHQISLIAAPRLIREEVISDGVRVVYLRRPLKFAHRIAFAPPADAVLLQRLARIVAERPTPLRHTPEELVVVQAPLRLSLTAPAEGAILVSDRAMKVHSRLQPFHEAQIASAVYAEWLRGHLTSGDVHLDYAWLGEGLGYLLARRYFLEHYPQTRSVQDWIELFNIFAIVDRFESAPQIPFVEAFFENRRVADPLRNELRTFNGSRPPGHMVMSKLREYVGPEDFDALVDACVEMPMPFRNCMSGAVSEETIEPLLAQWLQLYPSVDYRFDAVELNEGGNGRYENTLVVRREASRPFIDPVTVKIETLSGHTVDLHWKSAGNVARMSVVTEEKVRRVEIDPGRKTIDDDRSNNSRPPRRQILLDTAEVEVSSTEFGISGLLVARNRYDYRKDLALAGFYTNRSVGFTAGSRLHWGKKIDAARYRHNLYLFYGFQNLDGSFHDDSRPRVRTDGQLASVGVRYDYTTALSFDHPRLQRQLRLFGDWYDDVLGGDFDYGSFGAIAVVTHPLFSERTIGALQVLNGFTEPIGTGRVPNQGLFSLGGSRSIRGIGAEKKLGRNIFLVRSELRRTLFPEVDLNLFDLLMLRRAQLRLFVDAGRVDNSAGRVYDAGNFAVGVGTGFAVMYDFMGFFPSLFYIEVATRVDESDAVDDVQVLFGARQAF